MASARDELDNEPQAKEKDKNKDAVIQEYDVYLTPELQQQLYLLQYPNRARDHTFVRYAYPENMRIKPESGFLELDLPVHFTNFDKARGVEWGEALHRVKEEGGGGLGIAGGFGGNSGRAGGLRTRKAKVETAGAGAGGFVNGDAAADVGAEDEEVAKLVDNFEDSVERGRVLNKQTLGGQILKHQEGQPVYMLGAFRGQELHLTRISGLVQMRPQFHHIDAANRIAASARRRADTSFPPPFTEARAVFDSLKSADQEDVSTKTTTGLLQKARDEPWTDLQYFHEDTDEAYDAYFGSLMIDDTVAAEPLRSNMNNAEYLDAISAERVDPSGRTKKKPMTRQQMRSIDLSDSETEQPNNGKTYAVGSGAVSSSKAKGKGRA